MNRIIEVRISPQGEITLQTTGFAGAECRSASRFLEQALGIPISDRPTTELYESAPVENHIQA